MTLCVDPFCRKPLLRYTKTNLVFQPLVFSGFHHSGLKSKKLLQCVFSMSSLLILSGAADRTGSNRLPLEPLLWLADCTLSDTRPGLSSVSFCHIHSGCKHSWKSHCCVCSYRRPATYLQSVTTGCFWTVGYTVLMFVQVLAGPTANLGITSRFTVQTFTTEFQQERSGYMVQHHQLITKYMIVSLASTSRPVY